MGKKELFNLDDIRDMIENDKGFLVTDDHSKSIVKTTIHHPSCNSIIDHYVSSSYGPDLALGPGGKKYFYYYDSFDGISVDFTKSKPCILCNPKSLT